MTIPTLVTPSPLLWTEYDPGVRSGKPCQFPDAAAQIAPGFQHWLRSALGYGRPRPALSRLRVKVTKRFVIPLSALLSPFQAITFNHPPST
jgi:hypothetical protein